MSARFFGEFMGTAVLILMGNGVVAGVLLKHSKAEGAGWSAIAAGWAFAVMCGVFTAIACRSPDAPLNPAVALGPYLVGVLVWAIGLSLGGTTGYAINPARDLGPRIAHSLLPLGKKAGSGWNYAVVPIVGPLLGAALAGTFVRLVHF